MVPKLDIIALEKIKPLMRPDDSRIGALRQAISKSGIIKNPISVTRIVNNQYLLLDDSSILRAADSLEINDLPVQIFTFSNGLGFRSELFTKGFKFKFIDDFHKIFPREFTVYDDSRAIKPARNCIIITVKAGQDSEWLLAFKKRSGAFPSAFFNFFEFLDSKCILANKLYPIAIKSLNVKNRDIDAHLTVTNLDRRDIISSINRGYLFPTGLIQFNLSYKILGMDYPVNILQSCASIKDKRHFLYDLMNFRLNSNKSEFVKNGIMLLDY